MGNEMGNNNVSGLKEEENKAGEAARSSAGEGNPIGNGKGESQRVPAGEDKDFQEKSEGLSSEHPSDGNAQIGYNEAPPSAENENPVDNATETNLEKVLGANDKEIKDQTSFGEEEEGARNSTGEAKSALLDEEPLEPAATEGNQQERGEIEAKGNMGESVVSDAKVDEPATEDESVVTCTGDDDGETNAEGEVENGLSAVELTLQSGFDDTCDEVPGLVELARNGSSKSSEEAGSEIKSSVPLEEDYDPQDECIARTEDKDRENHPWPQFHEVVEQEAKADEVNASQPDPGKESMADSSRNSTLEKDNQSDEMTVAENGYHKDISNGEVKEKSRDMEEVIQMAPATGMFSAEGNHDKEEPKEKVVNEMEEKTENMQALESGIEATRLIDYHENPILASSDPSPKSPDQNQDSEIESNAVFLTDANQERCTQFIVTGSSVVDTNNSAEPAVFSEVGLQNGKAEDDLQRFPGKMSLTVAETEAAAEQPNEKSVESKTSEAEESSARFSTGSVSENPRVAAELRKSPSFGFDLPHKTRSEESDQTPLLHHEKTAFRSLHYEAISVEEKTIRVERSDSDKSRAPFLNFLKEEKKAKLMANSQKEDDDHEGETVKESSAITKRSGKRRPRPSIFSTCICCAAAIN